MAEKDDRDDALKEIKTAIRSRVRTERRALSQTDRDQAAQGFLRQLQQLLTARGARSVAAYIPVNTEPDIHLFLTWCSENNIRLLLPSCRPDYLLDWVEWVSGETVPGMYGIPEPLGSVFSPNEVAQVDIILVPAAAVDGQGVRLGWGGGFYDRTLGSMLDRPDVFAIVYDSEIYEELPREVHDTRVTGALTPTAIHYFDRAALPTQQPTSPPTKAVSLEQ